MDTLKIGRLTVVYEGLPDEVRGLKREIFDAQIYAFETKNPQPRIIDAGAHIGLATLYFKYHYPQSHITAIEPLPQNAVLLARNVWENRLEGVEVVQAALDEREGERHFFADSSGDAWYSTAGFYSGAWNGKQSSETLRVQTRPLSDFLGETVDFLKLDVEGAEEKVLIASGEHIAQVREMVIEYHPLVGNSQERIERFLRQHHFSVELGERDGDGLQLIRAKRQN